VPRQSGLWSVVSACRLSTCSKGRLPDSSRNEIGCLQNRPNCAGC
jgi:hypothetical protein